MSARAAAGTSTTARSRICRRRRRSGLARLDKAGQRRHPRRPARRGAPDRVREPPGSSSASSSCTGAIRCCTSPSSTWPATTGTTRRPGSGPAPGWRTWPPGRKRWTTPSPRSTRSAGRWPRRCPGRPGGWPWACRRTRTAARGRGAGRARAAGRPPGAAAGSRRSRHRSGQRRAGRADGQRGGLQLDLGRLGEQADAERDRLRERLAESCAQIDPAGRRSRWPASLSVTTPRPPGVVDAARQWTGRAIEFTRDRDLMPYHDGECLVGLAPPSRRWAMAMMSWNAPGEPEGPSWYHITPPEESWPAAGDRGMARGVQRDHPARDHRARGRARALLARPGDPPGADGGPAGASVGRVHRGLGALCRGAVRRGGILLRRPAVRDRRLAGGARPGHPAGLRDRRAHRRDDGAEGARRFEADTHLAGRPRCPRRGGPRSTPPTAATPGASS